MPRPVQDGDQPLFSAWTSDPGAPRVAGDPTDRGAGIDPLLLTPHG
ncbi:hypothetical protein G3I43_28040 [Streptomyces anulatus]|uniref:Uncharacterized protein n=1 Tax=Streptomyces anulatus TaxID=1892 RepID=A0A6G3T047_STRAQ|nr:hypothetical protein [Streptomyces anulatus]NDZ61819.1 hypothetical protein [Streptomyces anulatus]NEB87988.1 hypothetical protein [Streptomyces anulatus]